MATREHSSSITDQLKTLPLYALPHHAISRLVGHITRWRLPWWKNLLIRLFMRAFDVNLDEAQESKPEHWPHFNAFFTRALADGARPLPEHAQAIASPADGTVSACGRIEAGQLIQAKGQRFSLQALLGDDAGLAQELRDGGFLTVYLSPRDYHRVHMPCAGTLTQMIHVPGRLFSVAPHTVRAVPGLFARNERVICRFKSDHGPFVLILIGAICVASIETVWQGVVTPPAGHRVRAWAYREAPTYGRGEEMGRFNMGSTVILLSPPGAAAWRTTLQTGSRLRMGEAVGDWL